MTMTTQAGIHAGPPPPPAAKKRRWWFYGLIGLGGLLGLVVTGLIVLAAYWSHLVKTYVTDKPLTLPSVENPEGIAQGMQARLAGFQAALDSGANPAPLGITADELNGFMQRMPGFTGRISLFTTNNQLNARFSVPLDRTRNKQLKGKFLNGVMTLQHTYQDGYLILTAAQIKANGKPIPQWMLTQIQKRNFLEQIYQNTPAMELFQHIQSITIQDNQILFKPFPPEPAR